MKKTLTIVSAYQWNKTNTTKKNNSELAIKSIVDSLKKKFPNKINYKRLRGSAGLVMIESILRRIENADVIIIDLTNYNSNVMIELGMSIALCKIDNNKSVYLIKEQKAENDLLVDLPSDLQGYFISGYVCTNGKVIFKDNLSLLMSISSDVNDIIQDSIINEIEFKI